MRERDQRRMQMQATKLFPESRLQDFQVEVSFENNFFDLAIQGKFQTIQEPPGWKMDTMAILCCRGKTVKVKVLVYRFSLTLFDPMTLTHRALLSMGFSKYEYWSGLPCPSPGDHPNPGIKPRSPTLQADSLPFQLPRKPSYTVDIFIVEVAPKAASRP